MVARDEARAVAGTDERGGPRGEHMLDRGYASGRSTRELLIRTAERLFAERGIHAVSLREIGHAAGQRNNGVTQYHFGNRENLLVAIYLFRARQINARRRALLRELTTHDELGDASALLRAILLPHVESIPNDDNHFVSYLARVLTDEASLMSVHSDEVMEHLDALVELEAHLQRCVPELTAEQFATRYSMVFSWAIHSLAEYERTHRATSMHELGAMFDELVVMLTNALCMEPTSKFGTRARTRTARRTAAREPRDDTARRPHDQ